MREALGDLAARETSRSAGSLFYLILLFYDGIIRLFSVKNRFYKKYYVKNYNG